VCPPPSSRSARQFLASDSNSNLKIERSEEGGPLRPLFGPPLLESGPVLVLLAFLGWMACIVYSTVPAFWLLVHSRVDQWRKWRISPYTVLLPAWFALWVAVLSITWWFKNVYLYSSPWAWLPGGVLFALGAWMYIQGGAGFSLIRLGGLPELYAGHHEQRLITTGIRQRVRHPIYLAHLLEMLAWSVGTGLAVCFALTVFAVVTGAAMIRAEDAELERRFGGAFRDYKAAVPAVVPSTRHV
jgi:protein-S-isoprenylcysteine O-methyltransferase Ste14